jgi:hypothetical protein
MDKFNTDVKARQAYLLGSLDLAYASQIGHATPELEAEVKALFALIPCSPVAVPVRNRYLAPATKELSMDEHVYICPMTKPSEATIPLEVRQMGLVLWWRCALCQARQDDDWHMYVTPEQLVAAKRIYDGTTTRQFRILRPINIDIDAIIARREKVQSDAS